MHYPVMLQNVIKAISALNIHRKITLADCNFGLGGHSNSILKQFPNCAISGFDLDAEILRTYASTPELHTGDQSRLSLFNNNFTQLLRMGNKFDVLLADLGFNSLQLQQNQGFSWNKDTKLDMRYNRNSITHGQPTPFTSNNTTIQTCEQLIKRISFIEIVEILVKYGDLNTTEAKLAAKSIEQKRPKTTFQLRDSVVGCFQTNKTRKVAQVFQAMRVAVNGELQSLKLLCEGMDSILNKNALVMLITFHSLERDVVYRCIKQKQKLYSKIKVEHPSKQQIEQNSRSKSAQMLVFKKL